MTDTDKTGCRLISECMEAYGITHVVTSPGSRNAPLIMAFSRRSTFKVHSVVDERSAAFIALGIAEITGDPVALVCTSGTAVLNYAPALAEAFYRHIPLIAISADRPIEWIDQNDSQTIRQSGALSSIVRKSISISGELSSGDEIWYANRMLNDTMHAALHGVRGPVHINVPLSMPLTDEIHIDDKCVSLFHKIEWMGYGDRISTTQVKELARQAVGKRVLVICTVNEPDDKLSHALGLLASLPNVTIVAEGIANVHAKGIHCLCDQLFATASEEYYDRLGLVPELLISFGGAAVSANLKRFLRQANIREHWHIGETDCAIDCFRHLSLRIEINPKGFFPRFASAMAHLVRVCEVRSNYATIWSDYATHISECSSNYLGGQTHVFNAPIAVDRIIRTIPPAWNLQLSNGMSVRYALACSEVSKMHRIDCNRGVSGIDGSVSTAVGAATVFKGTTLLITGDMSMQYDIGALSSKMMSNRLKIVVLNNNGGGIFRFVRTTCELPERDRFFCCGNNLPLQEIATAYGFIYLQAANLQQLDEALEKLVDINDSSVILEIFTDAETDAEYFRKLISSCQH